MDFSKVFRVLHFESFIALFEQGNTSRRCLLKEGLQSTGACSRMISKTQGD